MTTSGTPLSETRPDFEPSLRLPFAAAIAAAVWFTGHGLAVIFGPELRVMEWLYDDTFYYLITASHFSAQHISSFDGVTRTSGYHPLWMWLCSLVYGIRGALDLTYVRCCMSMTFLIAAILLLVSLHQAWRSRNAGLLWALALGASSYSALNNGITVMEWPLVLLSWFLVHTHLLRFANLRQPSAWRYPAIFLIGALGTFSRTDFGLVPACYLAAALLLGMRRQQWTFVRPAALALAGSALALPLVFLYNLRMTGSWLQSSAEIKHLLASLTSPWNPVPALWQFLRVLLYLPPLDLRPDHKSFLLSAGLFVLLALTVIVAGMFLFARPSRHRFLSSTTRRAAPDEFIFVASCLGVAAYVLLYSFNTQATYGWYTGEVTGFIVLLAARMISIIPPSVRAAVVLALLLFNIGSAQFRGGNARAQMVEVYIGQELHARHPGATMGGGDVGKPSFYNGGTVINLDGLMNNEIVPYLAQGDFECYVLRRHIEFMSDIGTVSQPIIQAERASHGLPPMPWNVYFPAISFQAPPEPGIPAYNLEYRRTNFDAIRASGACPNDQ